MLLIQPNCGSSLGCFPPVTACRHQGPQALVSRQQPGSLTGSALGLRPALLLRAAVPGSEIRDFTSGEQPTARSGPHRTAAGGGDDRCDDQQFAGLRRQPQRPAPPRGSALEARPKLCPHRSALAAAERDGHRPRPAGLAADATTSLEPCIPSRGVRRRQNEPWFIRVELFPPLLITPTAPMAIA
jgi:hypothetical protein